MGSGILLAPSRIQASGENAGREISLAPVAVPAELPDAVFESAEWEPME
jgi:hypothetical protein